MLETLQKALGSVLHPSVEQRRQRFVAGVVCSATIVGGLPILAAFRSDDIRDVRGRPGTYWLSGEAQSQVVLAAARGSLASIALPVDSQGGGLDIVDTGAQVLAQNRTTGAVIMVDGVAARVGEQPINGPVPIDSRPVLVAAGSDAYVVDTHAPAITRFAAPAVVGNPPIVETVAVKRTTIDEWVSTTWTETFA